MVENSKKSPEGFMANYERFGQKRTGSVNTAIDEFRNLINDLSRISNIMILKGVNWDKVCTGMDVIDHTEAAITAYEQSIAPKNLGELYLSVYGLFQSLVVQQDALKGIFQSLEKKFELKTEPSLIEIRDLRNDCIGHPVSRDHGVPPRSNTFYSEKWSKDHFRLVRYFHNSNQRDSIEIYPLELIKMQREAISRNIKIVTEVLKKMENDHRESFKEKSCQAILNGYGYLFEKMFGALDLEDANAFSLGVISFEEIENSLSELRLELERRELHDSLPGVQLALEEIKWPLRRLSEYFSSESEVQPLDARSFLVHFKCLIENLHKMAGEIDKEYEKRL